jgi:hypothetical protein
VDEEEDPKRDYARQLVQFPEQERVTEFYRHQLGLVLRMTEILEANLHSGNIRRQAFYDTRKIL